MRILHFSIGRCNPYSANGVDQAIYHLSRAQAARGHTVAAFSLSAKEPFPIPGVQVGCYPPGRFPFALPGRLLADIAGWQPDVVHLHSIFAPANAALASWLFRRSIPYALTPHRSLSPAALARKRLLKLTYKRLFELPTLNRAAFLHAVAGSHGLRGYGARSPVVVAPNGIDLTAIPPAPRAGLLASRYPQVGGKRVFLFLGRLDPWYKGLDLLLQGFALASAPEAVLVLVGPDYRGQKRRLVSLACELGLEARVLFAGAEYGPGKFDLLAGADVFVLCSRSEGMPLAVLEAAACARPCLVSPEADPGGLLEHYQAGLVAPLDAEGIGEGFRRLAAMEPVELRRMGGNARRMVEQEFSWSRTAGIVIQAYEEYARAGLGKSRRS